MRFSENWLRTWADPATDTAGLTHALTMGGLEVDAVEPAGPDLTGIVVGRIESAEPHPDADDLLVCDVDTGGAATRRIVCGAPNARAGQLVPVALPGTTLPGGLTIGEREVLGITSAGMICSAAELGLEESSAGILELDPDAAAGTDLADHLALGDRIIELDLTPNRGDCLGIEGIAREVAALTGAELSSPAAGAPRSESGRTLPVVIEAAAACPRYTGRVVEGIQTDARTPDWMRERLRRSGVRSVSPVVDVTNYVMLELGQPLHAFDLARVEGGIVVREAGPGESLTLLDGERVELEPGILVIADHARPVALAGIMGGADSAVDESTRDVFLESALFTPEALSGRARRYGLHTDSSHRFERGVDPTLQARALDRATELLQQVAGGRPGPLCEAGESASPWRAPVGLRASRVERVLGLKLSVDELGAILARLGMYCEAGEGGLSVCPPAHRYDIGIEADLIEEVARVYGYENLPSGAAQGTIAVVPESEAQLGAERMREVLVQRGYREAITYSFVDAELQTAFDPDSKKLDLANPLSRDMAQMRSTLWPGLFTALQHNLNRQQSRVRLFETGLRFERDRDGLLQEPRLAGIAYGSAYPEHWDHDTRPVDFFDVKGDLNALLRRSGLAASVRYRAGEHPALHPGQAAELLLDAGEQERAYLGWLGAMHPALVRRFELARPPVLFELDLERLSAGMLPAYRALSRYPSVRRDLAVVVAEEVTAEQLTRTVRGAAGELLSDLVLFDVYRGSGVEAGRKSVALGLILQHSSRTLEDSEVDALMERVVSSLRHELAAQTRE